MKKKKPEDVVDVARIRPLPSNLKELKQRVLETSHGTKFWTVQYISRIDNHAKGAYGWFVRPPMKDGKRVSKSVYFPDTCVNYVDNPYTALREATKYLSACYVKLNPKNRLKEKVDRKTKRIAVNPLTGEKHELPVGVSFKNRGKRQSFVMSIPVYGANRSKVLEVAVTEKVDFDAALKKAKEKRSAAEAAYKEAVRKNIEAEYLKATGVK